SNRAYALRWYRIRRGFASRASPVCYYRSAKMALQRERRFSRDRSLQKLVREQPVIGFDIVLWLQELRLGIHLIAGLEQLLIDLEIGRMRRGHGLPRRLQHILIHLLEAFAQDLERLVGLLVDHLAGGGERVHHAP